MLVSGRVRVLNIIQKELPLFWWKWWQFNDFQDLCHFHEDILECADGDEHSWAGRISIFPTKWRAKGRNKVRVVRTNQLPSYIGIAVFHKPWNKDPRSWTNQDFMVHVRRVLLPFGQPSRFLSFDFWSNTSEINDPLIIHMCVTGTWDWCP